jgi:hypothetical protein
LEDGRVSSDDNIQKGVDFALGATMASRSRSEESLLGELLDACVKDASNCDEDIEIVEFMLQTAVRSLNVAESRIELGQRLPEPDLDAPLSAVVKAKTHVVSAMTAWRRARLRVWQPRHRSSRSRTPLRI